VGHYHSCRNPLSLRERGRGEGTGVSVKGQPQFLSNPRQNGIEIGADLFQTVRKLVDVDGRDD